MSRLRRAPLVLLAALLAATPAAAQIAGHPFEVSAGAGLLHFDSRTQTKDAPGYAAGLGWRAQPWLSFEGAGLYSASKADFGSEPQRSPRNPSFGPAAKVGALNNSVAVSRLHNPNNRIPCCR